MSLTTFDATPQKPDANAKDGGTQNALAQALTGRTCFAEVEKNVTAALAQGGSEALQQTLGNSSGDMNSKNIALEQAGALPQSKNVANLDDATSADKCCDFQSMMGNDVANAAMDNALANVENPKN